MSNKANTYLTIHEAQAIFHMCDAAKAGRAAFTARTGGQLAILNGVQKKTKAVIAEHNEKPKRGADGKQLIKVEDGALNHVRLFDLAVFMTAQGLEMKQQRDHLVIRRKGRDTKPQRDGAGTYDSDEVTTIRFVGGGGASDGGHTGNEGGHGGSN